MVHKPIAIMILSLALAGTMILAILTAIPSKNHAFAFGNSFTVASPTSSEENNNTGSGQESGSSSSGSGQESGSSSSGSGQESGSSNTGSGSGQESGSSSSGSVSQSNTTGSVSQSNSTGNATGVDANGILAVHNSERAAVGVPPLVWSDKLAADAKVWAEHIVATGVSAHDPDRGGEGENIAGAGPTSCTWSRPDRSDMVCTPATVSQMQAPWVSEKKDYHGAPCCSVAGEPVTGHYTQMVWRDTKEVGCAIASGAHNVLVCRYSPPGNYIGKKPY
jgi:hypothetical protein